MTSSPLPNETSLPPPGPADVDARTPMLVMGMGIDLYGKERRVMRMVSRMPRLLPLFLISSWDRGDVSAELTRQGLPWRKASFGYLGFARPQWTLKNIALMPMLFWKVIQARRQHGAKVLLFTEVLSFLNALPVFLTWRLLGTVRIVFYLGDIGGGTAVQRGLLRLADRAADVIIVNSQAVRRGLEECGMRRAPIHVVYNGIVCNEFEAPSDHAVHSDGVVVGFVGQFKENKGVADFLEAARQIAASDSTTRFVVIGACPQGSEYPEQIRRAYADLADRVEYLGFVSDMPQRYRTMDVVVVPSRHADPAPNVNLEAMAAGLPVIATDVGGSPELILDGVTGLLVPPRQPAAIAEALRRLIADPELRLRMGRSGQARCREVFDADLNARKIEALILPAASTSRQAARSAKATVTDSEPLALSTTVGTGR
jgi:glycosyltransferase involved in cell wall biosynthesis